MCDAFELVNFLSLHFTHELLRHQTFELILADIDAVNVQFLKIVFELRVLFAEIQNDLINLIKASEIHAFKIQLDWFHLLSWVY